MDNALATQTATAHTRPVAHADTILPQHIQTVFDRSIKDGKLINADRSISMTAICIERRWRLLAFLS